MYSEEYEFSAGHETGHALCAECFPLEPRRSVLSSFPLLEEASSRIQEIGFGYDELEKRFDGLTACDAWGLSDKQLLFQTLGGRVAELMARTEGNWNVAEIQNRHLNGEFDQTQDMEHIKALLNKLCPDNKNNEQEQILTETISQVFSYLKERWDIVKHVVSDLLSKYDHKTQKAMVLYNALSPATKELLRQIRETKN